MAKTSTSSSQPIRNGISSGSTFAVILIFLALIGFTVTGAGLIAKMVGRPPVGVQLPGLGFLVTFLVLIGLWNGSGAARPDPLDDRLSPSLLAGAIAGLIAGVASAVLALIFGSLLASNTDPRTYLSAISPEFMRFYNFNQGAVVAGLIHLVLLLVSGVLGALLAFNVRKFGLRQKVVRGITNTTQRVRGAAVLDKIRSTPYAIYVVYALVAVLLFILPRSWGSYWNYIVGTVGIYVILGLGLNIIVGLAGQLVLGYVAFFAIGSYAVALLTAPQPHNLDWNFWIALGIGVLLSAFTGILLGLPILRLRGDYLAIVTLGFGEIIRIMLRSDLLTGFTAGPKGVRDISGPTLFGQPFSSDVQFTYLIFLAVLIMIFFTDRLQNSRAGRAWVAIREDEIAARATGINTFQSKLLALAIGAAFAGLGGVLFASRNQFTGPEDHSLMVSINVLALVIVGGMGSIPGIILGAFALKGLPEMLRELENFRLMFFGGLLVVMMILRPEGLWPATRPNLEKLPEAQTAPGLPAQETGKAKEVEGVKHAS